VIGLRRRQGHEIFPKIEKAQEEFHHHEEEPERTGAADYCQFAARD
jgi:hypothetical protein